MSDYKLELAEPTDNELLEWAEDEQFFLFCDEDEFLQIARSVIHKYGRKGTIDVLTAGTGSTLTAFSPTEKDQSHES